MTKTIKPRETRSSAKPTEQKKSEVELDDKELEKVSGGTCASGKHIKDGVIIT
jgi:bacteriocin-like protein